MPACTTPGWTSCLPRGRARIRDWAGGEVARVSSPASGTLAPAGAAKRREGFAEATRPRVVAVVQHRVGTRQRVARAQLGVLREEPHRPPEVGAVARAH